MEPMNKVLIVNTINELITVLREDKELISLVFNKVGDSRWG
jgi:hypothetical protein